MEDILSRFDRPLTLIIVFNIVYFLLNIFRELSRQQLGQQRKGERNKRRVRCNKRACLERPQFGGVGRLKMARMQSECVQVNRSQRKKEMVVAGRASPGTTFVPMKKEGENEEYSYYCCVENETPLIVSKKCNVEGKLFLFVFFSFILCHTIYDICSTR